MSRSRTWKRGDGRRLAALGTAYVFFLQLLLTAYATVLFSPHAAAADGAMIPVCSGAGIGWVKAGQPPDPGKGGGKGGVARDCPCCCPHGPAAVLPPASMLAPARLPAFATKIVIARPRVRVGWSTAPPLPSRGPPTLAS